MELRIDRSKITEQLEERIGVGDEIMNRNLRHHDDLMAAAEDRKRFDQFNAALITKAFGAESDPTRIYEEATKDTPLPISVGNAPSFETYARLFKSSTSTRVNGLRSVLEQVDLYDDPPEITAPGFRGVSAEAARLGLSAEMVAIIEGLAEHPTGVDNCQDAGFTVTDPDTDRAFRELRERRIIRAKAYQDNGSGRTTMVDGVALTREGWATIERLRSGPPAPAQPIQLNVGGHVFGNVQAAGAGSNQTATSHVDASVTNDLGAFTDLLRTALDEDGDRLGGDAYEILEAQLDALDEERSTGPLNPQRIRGYLLAIIGVLGALGLDGRWPDILEAGQTILEHLPAG